MQMVKGKWYRVDVTHTNSVKKYIYRIHSLGLMEQGEMDRVHTVCRFSGTGYKVQDTRNRGDGGRVTKTPHLAP